MWLFHNSGLYPILSRGTFCMSAFALVELFISMSKARRILLVYGRVYIAPSG